MYFLKHYVGDPAASLHRELLVEKRHPIHTLVRRQYFKPARSILCLGTANHLAGVAPWIGDRNLDPLPGHGANEDRSPWTVRNAHLPAGYRRRWRGLDNRLLLDRRFGRRWLAQAIDGLGPRSQPLGKLGPMIIGMPHDIRAGQTVEGSTGDIVILAQLGIVPGQLAEIFLGMIAIRDSPASGSMPTFEKTVQAGFCD
jgi:hypothetical protein